MTREEATKVLSHIIESYKTFPKMLCKIPHAEERKNEYVDALKVAIEALSAEHKYCWDCKHYEPKYNVCHAPEVVKQVTSKLNNPCDSLLTDDSTECKEQKSKLDLISRADAIALLTKIVFDEPPYFDSETLCRLYAEEQINALPSADAGEAGGGI